jgi:RNA binding exosome subunit
MKTFDEYLEMVHRNMIPNEEMIKINAILLSTENADKLANKLRPIVSKYVKDDNDIEETIQSFIQGKKQ